MRLTVRALIAQGCLFLLFASPRAESVTAARFISKDFEEDSTREGTMYFADKVMRLDPEPQGKKNVSVIFRGDRQQMIVLDHSKKTYFIVDERMIGQVSSRINKAMEEMEKQLAGLPEAQQEMARRMMKNQMPTAQTSEPDYRLEARQDSKEISGYSCRLTEVYRGADKVTSIWLTNEVDDRRINEVFRDLAHFVRGLRSSAQFVNFEMDLDFISLENVDGFPIMIENLRKATMTQRTTFSDIGPTEKDVRFEPDPDYKAKAPKGFE